MSWRRLRIRALPKADRDIATSVGASFGTQLALLISGVAQARILGVLDRGRSQLLLYIATVLPLILTIGLPVALTYWLALNPRTGRRLLSKLTRTLVIQGAAMVSIDVCVLFVVFRNSPSSLQEAAAISLLGVPAIALWIYGLAILQGNRQFTAMNLCRLIFPPLNAAVLLTFLLVGVRGLVLVTIVWVSLYGLSGGVTALAAYRGVLRESDDHDDSEIPSARTMLVFGLKSQLGSVTPLEGFQLDQAVVGLMISQAALGIYAVGVAFTNLPRFIAQGIGLVAYPNVAAETDPHRRSRAIVRFVAMALVLPGIIVAVTELAVPYLVPLLFGKAFTPAVGVARILMISAVLFGVRRVLTECARGAGRPLLGSVAEAVSLVLLGPAVALFASQGAKGVATAMVVISIPGVLIIAGGLLFGRQATVTVGRARRAAAVAVEVSPGGPLANVAPDDA